MAETTACPRCGYDQRGVIDSWTRSCPLRGICSECGLEFRWRNLLDPRFMGRPGLYEHAKRQRLAQFLYTLWRSLRPWSFWEWVRMEDQIVPSRLLAFFGLMQPLLFIAAVLASMLFIVVAALPLSIGWSTTEVFDLFVHVVSVGQYNSGWMGGWQLNPFPLMVPIVLLIAPWLMLVFGQSMRLAHVRRGNLARIFVYSSIIVPLTIGMLAIGRGITRLYGLEISYVDSLDYLFSWAVIPAVLCLCFQVLSMRWAVGRYLRLDHAWGVAIAIGGISASVLALGYVFTLWWIVWMWGR